MTPSTSHDATFQRGTTPRFYQRGTDRTVLRDNQTDFESVESASPSPAEVMAAFFAYVQSQLAALRRAPRSADARSIALLSFLESQNFTAEEIGRIGFGLFTSISDIRTYLRSVGFSDAVIDESGLLEDEQESPRHEWHESLVLPVHDRFGEIVDWLRVDLGVSSRRHLRYTTMFGFETSGVPVYGTDSIDYAAGHVSHVLLVDDVLDAARLRGAGIVNVLATAGREDAMAPRRWEQLSDLGIQSVTLLFRNSADAHHRIRGVQTTALRARRTPQIHVFDSMQFGPEGSACDFVREHGEAAFRHLLANSSLVYRAKDLDWAPRTTTRWRRPAPRPFHAETFWSTVDWHLGNIRDSQMRSAFTSVATDVAEALSRGAYHEARRILDRLLEPVHQTPGTVSLQGALVQLQDRARADRLTVPNESQSRSDATVTTIVVDRSGAQIPRMAEVLVDNLQRRPDSTWTVVCDDPQLMTLHVVHELANRQTSGPGLTMAETVDRLALRDPQGGFGDKPWIVDEAVDQLQQWSGRVRFVGASARWHEELQDAPTTNEPPTGILVGPSAKNALQPGGETSPLFRIAARLGCEVVSVTVAESHRPNGTGNGGNGYVAVRSGEAARFHEVLSEIVDRAEHRDGQQSQR
ncbi:hypothetical protein Mal4_17660 [Maioricimonas rarisocia]|uniref:Uncharacterized protein n=1 Tax=Maioricimonas rarisocia TaxID=2528026 RepID=A0A517Z4Q7_9PLAN|nr:hypothetical protein [Maioricimonas rarisocia]QDU37453.1 hypothetical protein Mal4_17660 [Maioricimonas rarisocia]